jgi:hypothetical protein
MPLTLACRRGERDRGRLVAVELRGRLRRRDVPARSGCGRIARARAIVAVRHCGALQTRANLRATAAATCRGSAPRETTSTAARWGLSSMGRCPTRSAAWRAGRRSRDCAPLQPPSHALTRFCMVLHEPSTHAAHRIIKGYPGLVGSLPPTISALTTLTWLCALFARPGSPPMRRMRRFVWAWAVHLRCGRMPRLARSGACPRTASPARSSRASRRSPGWPTCAPRYRPCGLPADSRVLNGRAAAQGPQREPLLRQRAADDLRADRAHCHVRPLHKAGLAADAAPASQRERSGCTWAVHLRRSRMPPLCAVSYVAKNGFTGPIPASITALTRLALLYAAPPPVRSPGRLVRAEKARCGAGPLARTASPAARRRRSLR